MVAVDVLDRGAVHLCALEFPSREAAEVEMVSVQARHNTVRFPVRRPWGGALLLAAFRCGSPRGPSHGR